MTDTIRDNSTDLAHIRGDQIVVPTTTETQIDTATTSPVFAVGSNATLSQIAQAVVQDEHVILRGDYQFLPETGHPLRPIALLAVGAKLAAGAEALGITEVDLDHIVIRRADREEDSEGWLLTSAANNLKEGDEGELSEVLFTRVF